MIRLRLMELAAGMVVLAATGSLAYNLTRPEELKDVELKATRVVDEAALASADKTNTCSKGKVILSFDDGPDAYTPQVLEVLRAYDVKAVFFALGSKAVKHPEMIKAEIADGHSVQNHSWDHPHLADLSRAQVREQIQKTQDALIEAGAPKPTYFRPPFGNISQNVVLEVNKFKPALIFDYWDIDTNDWRGRKPDDIADTVIKQLEVKPPVPEEQTVLLHDGVRNSFATVEALPKVIEGIRKKGFCTALPSAQTE
ncbi:polysaccharide deacetylase family protein [Actinocorallia longicatena]|uniref:NodB homology domain-containing protein n=1 Tax=Actinocorallia longicatena TaxID=111803 RepID=A0ABP6QF05_9ACTN